MRGKKRLRIIGLGVLAFVTAILVIWSLPQVRNPRVAGVPAQPAPTLTWPSANDTPSPTPTNATSSPSAEPAPQGLPGVAALLAGDEDVTILVMGDGSGNEPDEWVALWAEDHLAKDHRVKYKVWDADTRSYDSAGTSGSTGSVVTLWNAGMTAPNLSTEDNRVAKVWQPADLVILSYGHRNAATAIGARLTAFHKAIKAQDGNPIVLVMIQNPDPVATEVTQRETTQAVEKWAKSASLDTINVYDAFIADPAPRYLLVEADGSPTPKGSAIWATTVADAIKAAA